MSHSATFLMRYFPIARQSTWRTSVRRCVPRELMFLQTSSSHRRRRWKRSWKRMHPLASLRGQTLSASEMPSIALPKGRLRSIVRVHLGGACALEDVAITLDHTDHLHADHVSARASQSCGQPLRGMMRRRCRSCFHLVEICKGRSRFIPGCQRLKFLAVKVDRCGDSS